MKLYYSAIIYIVIAAMAGLGLQLKSNDVLSKSEKKGFAFTMAILMIVSLAEWTGVIVEGKSTVLIPLHKLVKCIYTTLGSDPGNTTTGTEKTKKLMKAY